MIATGEGLQVASCAKYAIDKITSELQADEQNMKILYDLRLKDERHKAAWETAQRGKNRALEIKGQLDRIRIQALGMNMLQVTLSAEECALFAYGESA